MNTQITVKDETKGRRLLTTMHSRGYSDISFAEETGIPADQIYLYTTNLADVTTNILTIFASALNTSKDFLDLKSESDIPDGYTSWDKDIKAEDKDAHDLNYQLYRNAQIKDLLQALGMRFSPSCRVKEKKYYCTKYGEWFAEDGVKASFDAILDDMRSNFNDSEYLIDVFYRGHFITLSEHQLNDWFTEAWNDFIDGINDKFGLPGIVKAETVDDDIDRALKGLPDLDRSL